MNDDEKLAIIEALAQAEMSVPMYDIKCDVVSRDSSVRRARTEKFHKRLTVTNQLGATKALISLGYPAPDSDFSAEGCREWLYAAVRKVCPSPKRSI